MPSRLTRLGLAGLIAAAAGTTAALAGNEDHHDRLAQMDAMVAGGRGALVYEAQVGRHAQLFTVDAQGRAARQLTNFTDSDAVWGAWSPDGKRIVFERDVFAGERVSRAQVETITADGSRLRALTTAGFNGRPSWSPNGKLIVFSTQLGGNRARVSLMSAEGADVRPVLTARGLGLDSPTFSPDRMRIAFVWVKRAGSAIFVVRTDGSGLEQVTPWKLSVADKIDWSPDGSRIGFSSPEFGIRAGISSNVFTIRPDGSGITKLTHSTGGTINNGFDSWSPDGKRIAFASNRSGSFQIYAMNAAGGGVTQVTQATDAHHASWGRTSGG